MRVCIKGTGADDCGCKNWLKGIRTINNQYPDDNREFSISAGAGILITPETAGIRITNTIPDSATLTEGDNIIITPGGDNELVISLASDPIINGNLQVNGDIIQNGSAYETHAEQVYTTKDYIITRDGAISALSSGDYSGFQVKKYDGTNDGRLVIDNQGVARVGDVGDEQPLLTRDESANMSNGALIAWDGTDQRAETLTGNVGSDSKPVKIVNGQTVEVTNALQRAIQYYAFSDNLNVTAGQEAQATAHDVRAGYNIIIANAVFNSGSSGIGGFVFGVNIDGTTTWCQSMYQIPANDTVRITLSIAYSMNTAHQFAIKMYSSSNITGANVNTKVISM